MLLLGNIAGWHDVQDPAKVEALAQAYRDGADVPPVVVIERDNMAVALSGVHRLAALVEVHKVDADAYETGHIHGWDWDQLYRSATTDEQREALELLLQPSRWSGDMPITCLLPLLDDEDRAALADQV